MKAKKKKNRIYYRKATVMETVPCCRLCFPAIYSLATFSVVISQSYRFVALCLPSTVGSTPHSVVFEIFLVAWGSETCFRFSSSATVLLLVLSGLWCFCVWLRFGNAMKRFYGVHCELLAFLSLAVYEVNVSCGEVTSLYVCVCLYWKSEYFGYCSSDFCCNKSIASNQVRKLLAI
jgi:hypothetical protein